MELSAQREPIFLLALDRLDDAVRATRRHAEAGRHLVDRLNKEILGNVSIKLFETGSPDVIEVAGRGELQLAVLIESMRREGYELQVSRPEVITKVMEGHVSEPIEHLVIDTTEQFVGTVGERLLSYALGRGVEYYDRPALRAILRDAAPGGYRWSAVIMGIVKSEPFQMRRAES